MRQAIFFDLDGTLLPLKMEAFQKAYFGGIRESGFLEQICREKGEEIFAAAVHAMVRNDGSALNRDVFFGTIERMANVDYKTLAPHMERFYANEFKQARRSTHADARVLAMIKTLKKKRYRLVLATNPLFPRTATNQRIEWAGLKPHDFEYVSYYDNSSYCKPKPEYYQEILHHTRLKARECYIVGNDVTDDMSALALGFKGFLVLDNLIGDIEKVQECERGDYSDLLNFARSLPAI